MVFMFFGKKKSHEVLLKKKSQNLRLKIQKGNFFIKKNQINAF